MPNYSGSCACGKVRFSFRSNLKALTNCYCNQCFRDSGMSPCPYGSVRRIDLIIEGKEFLRFYNSSAKAKRYFCFSCETYLYWQSEDWPEWSSVVLSNLYQSIDMSSAKEICRS